MEENDEENIENKNNDTFYSTFDEDIEKEENEKKEEIKKKIEDLKNSKIICRKCSFTPEINFINNNLIDITCKCEIKRNYCTQNFRREYIVNKKEEKIYTLCQQHNLKFVKYCQDCEKDICSECLNINNHSPHSFNNYLLYKNKINAIKEVIDDFEKKTEEEKKNDDAQYIIEIFIILIKYYSKTLLEDIKYPCQYYINTIENAYNFLDDFKTNRNKNKSSILEQNNRKSEIEYFYKIQLDKIEKNKTLSDTINIININGQNCYDLKIFEGKTFSHLIELHLEENNITNIDSLMNAGRFESLKELSFARNKINDDELLKHIDKFNYQFPKLEFLSFFLNDLTDYNIFKKVSELKGLKKLHLGSNRFEKNKIEEDIDFPNLEILGTANGVFNDKTIKYLSHFKFKNLKELYLQSNGLSSLNFLYTLNSKDLEVLWLLNNHLTEYKTIFKCDFKNMKDINLRYNNIDNIDDLKDYIKKYNNLKYLYLSNNPLNLEHSKIREIKKKIKTINDNLMLDLF